MDDDMVVGHAMNEREDIERERQERVDREFARSILFYVAALFTVLVTAYGLHLLLGD
jgi:hypothetical protein